MIGELLLEHLSLWGCVWQSTLFAVAGLVGSFLLRRRPARASQALFLAMVAAVIVPTISILVRHYELGVLAAKTVILKVEMPNEFIPPAYETSAAVPPPADIVDEVHTALEGPVLAEAAPARAHMPWRLIMLYGWMAAALILSGRLLLAFVGGLCLLRRAQSQGCEQIQRAADSARAKLGIAKGLRVRSSRDVHSPVIWCWSLTPALLVPGDLDRRVDWVGVVCHELAHWRRWDHISGLIAELVVCILPWNPFLWWSKKRMVRFSEQACDDWVVAGGQPREDYAQSLLNFKPQRQAAFVPAVVHSKRGLAGRVRRILKDSCGNPRTGARWALAVSVVALCLAVGIAFAQTRPARSTGTIKTKLGKSAAIERLASETIMIKGRILDPNNEPAYGASIVALPVTSWGYHTEPRRRNKEGYFELPWSPTWIEQDQPIYLMAVVQDPKSRAALVEVTDPTSPVTVRLEPAFAITGKVVDPGGQQIEECLATISLSTEFKCQAPIFGARGGRRWEHTLSPLPYGTKYELTVQAKGYRTRQIIVDGTDKSQKLIDLGTIVLQPQGRAKPVVAEQRQDPDLEKEFHEVYSLDKDEIIKLIKPPFVLGRQEYFQIPTSDYGYSFLSLVSQGAIQVCLIWDGEVLNKTGLWGYTNTHRPPTLGEVLPLILRMPYYDFNLPKELDTKMPYGDWIVRADSPRDEQLRSLGEIVYAETNRAIRFEKRTVEREVIVAKGRYEFKSHPSGNYPNHVHLTWDGTLDRSEGQIRSLARLFGRLEQQLKVIIVDETEPVENLEGRYKSGDLFPINHDPEQRDERLRALLDNLAKTTSLQFKVEHRPAEIWFVTETKNGSSPAIAVSR
jgi:beta-lactamase regulating signal transducer with metallopeptidase domain